MKTPPTRVLIVEDEAIIAAALAVRLEGLGYEISATVSEAEEVLAAAAEHPSDVALMDIHLKGDRTGIDAAGQLQAQLGVPVVYTTAYADAATIEKAKLTVPYGYLLKPYDDSSLKVAIELAVYRSRAERERRALERQLLQSQKLESVGRLASGIAHDFNNLLAIIYGISEMIELHPHATPKLLPDLRAAVDRGAGLVRRLMLFTRPEKTQVADVDVCEALTSLRKLLRRLMGAGVQLRVHLPPQLLYARLDPLQLDQLVMNLVINARDAIGGDGDGAVHVAVEPVDEAWLALSVRDSGAGISPEHRERIFEPFFSTKDPDVGTGLGLSLVRQIVEDCGGEITVRSTLGEGTTFIVRLPRAHPADETPPEPIAPISRGPAGRRILVVDDDTEVREILAMMLQSAGHQVTEASGAGEAIEAVSSAQEPFELMLTDVMMPYIRGPALAEAICRVHTSLRIGYISGFTDTADLQPLLPKPFRRETLLAFVDALLS